MVPKLVAVIVNATSSPIDTVSGSTVFKTSISTFDGSKITFKVDSACDVSILLWLLKLLKSFKFYLSITLIYFKPIN